MAVAEIVTIGTELLLGEIQDTNSRYIARALRDIGVDLYRLTTVGDNIKRITATLQEALMRADVVITTGGLGPTVDDPTRQAVADAFNVDLVFKEELWDQILERFTYFNRTPTENNKRQAYIPANAIAIRNDVGTAPAFAVELGFKTLIALPGVPREMEHIMKTFVVEYLKKRYRLEDEIILPWVVHTVSLGESSIDEIIGEMEKLSNPTVGLLAHPGQTDVRVTAKARSAEEAQRMMEPVLQEIREKLADYIYGENEETIQSTVAANLVEQNLALCVLEVGTDGLIHSSLAEHLSPELLSGQLLDVDITHETFNALMHEYREKKQADFVLGVMLTPQNQFLELYVALLDNQNLQDYQRIYSGPSGDAARWALNVGLDQVRTRLKRLKGTG
jgi:competence/damage-inducible protein CinA-like protein